MPIQVLLYAKQQMVHSLLLITGEHKRKPQYLEGVSKPSIGFKVKMYWGGQP
jgi:hypothetical protein